MVEGWQKFKDVGAGAWNVCKDAEEINFIDTSGDIISVEWFTVIVTAA